MVAVKCNSKVPTADVGELVEIEGEVHPLVDQEEEEEEEEEQEEEGGSGGAGGWVDVQQWCNSAPPMMDSFMAMQAPTPTQQEPSFGTPRSTLRHGDRCYIDQDGTWIPITSCRPFDDVGGSGTVPRQTQLIQGTRSPNLSYHTGRNLLTSASCSNLAGACGNIAAEMSGLSLSNNTVWLKRRNDVSTQFCQRFTSSSGSLFSVPQQERYLLHGGMDKLNKEPYETKGSPSQFDVNIPRFPVDEQEHYHTASFGNVYPNIRLLQHGSFGHGTLNHLSDHHHVGRNMIAHLQGIMNNRIGANLRRCMGTQYYTRSAGLAVSAALQDSLHGQQVQGLHLALQPTQTIDDHATRNHGQSFSAHTKYRNALIEPSFAPQKMQYGEDLLSGIPNVNGMCTGNVTLGHPLQRCLTSCASPLMSEYFLSQSERSTPFSSSNRYSNPASLGSWTSVSGKADSNSSLLEVYRRSNTINTELSGIVDGIVEFSSDQCGSRFIQQKLETASTEEINKIFSAILPHVLEMVVNVFGNYVIQKLFEMGTRSQRGKLASQIAGYVLPLSLQVFGCRVIQKALDVLDEAQQTEMISELDGFVVKCACDLNGNHVIQKCIECVPKARTEFVISSFHGQVASLSTHPYGCRVIQRILECFPDGEARGMITSEILQSASVLAQDQYGNYVVQHVLKYSEQSERSAIIIKLLGKIVHLSQHKHASNVVEKCLEVATPDECQLFIREILDPSDNSESLKVMMKDRYGNYVVQKVLETCNDQSRRLILSLVRGHLNELKKNTFAKHIIARVEKLITTGEMHLRTSSGPSNEDH